MTDLEANIDEQKEEKDDHDNDSIDRTIDIPEPDVILPSKTPDQIGNDVLDQDELDSTRSSHITDKAKDFTSDSATVLQSKEVKIRFDGVEVEFVTRDTQTEDNLENDPQFKDELQQPDAIENSTEACEGKIQDQADNEARDGPEQVVDQVSETNEDNGYERTRYDEDFDKIHDAEDEVDNVDFEEDEEEEDEFGDGDGITTVVTDDSTIPPLRDLDSFAGVEQVGPPRILRKNRESRQQQLQYPPLTEREKDDGVFAGQCDFCGRDIKPFPDADSQLYKHSREIFCCDDYQLFMQFALSKPFGSKYDVDVQKFVTAYMDIQPHAPYNKHARKQAKERAALRMREREVARQRKVVTQYQSQNQQNQQQAPQQQMYQQAADTQRTLKVINFSLGSKKCAEQGFLLDPPPERQTLLSKLGAAFSIETLDDQRGLETSRVPKKGVTQKFYIEGKKTFYVLFKDGSGTVYYQSGRPCIVILSTPKVTPPDHFAPSKMSMKSKSVSKNSRKVAGAESKAQIHNPNSAVGSNTPAVGMGSASEKSVNVGKSEDAASGIRRRQFLVFTDEVKARLLAVFMPDGNAACYFENSQLRLHMDPFGGILFGDNFAKKRKWSWWEFIEKHQHAPPLQPLTLALSNQVSLRIANQNSISLAYRAGAHSVKFNAGVKLKISNGKAALPKLLERTEDIVYLSEMQTYTQTIVSRMQNLLKYKNNEEMAERLPPPPYLSHQMEKKGMSMAGYPKLTGRQSKHETSSKSSSSPTKVQSGTAEEHSLKLMTMAAT